jgi:hypothetical protein
VSGTSEVVVRALASDPDGKVERPTAAGPTSTRTYQ